jgi:hypothetical protein
MKSTIVILCALCATAATTRADAKKEVESLVRTEATTILDENAAHAPRIDAIEIYPTTMMSNMRMGMYGALADNIVHTVDKLTVVVVGKVAWYHAVVVGSYQLAHCNATGDDCKKPTKEKTTWRLSGVARDEHGWKLAAVMWSKAISDAELFKAAVPDANIGGAAGEPPDPQKIVRAWFRGGSIAKDISSSALATANGTAPGEISQGAAAGKLATAWDALKMLEIGFSSKQWDTVAFVSGEVALPVKKKKGQTVIMKLGVVLVQENGNWRWVSINFSPKDES